MGRPRKPKATLKLHGTERDDRHSERFDDGDLASELVKPDDLAGDASLYWDEIVPLIQAANTGKSMDRAMVIGACQWWARYREAHTRLNDPKYANATPVVLNQLLALEGSAWKNFNLAAGKLGLSPVDRAKLHVTPHGKRSDFESDLTKHG